MATALYINQTQILAVTVGGSARKPRLKSVATGALAEARTEDGAVVVDRTKHLADQVAAFLKANKLGSGHKILLVGPDAMRYRELRLAFSDRRQINKVIQFQVEGAIPSVPIEDLAVGYSILSSDAAGSRVLVMAADKDYIKKRLDALEMAGVGVDSVDCNLSGTLNLGLLHEELSADKPATLWLDFAGNTAAVSLLSDGKVLSTRVFVSPYVAGAGGAAPTAEQSKAQLKQLEAQAIGTAQQAPRDEYVLLTGEPERDDTDSGNEPATLPAADTANVGLPKSESVNLGAQQVADRNRKMSREELLKFVGRVAAEARRSLYMMRLEVPVLRLVVSGLGPEGQHLAAALANELQIENFSAIDLMDTVNPVGRDGERGVKTPDLGEITFLTGVALKGLGRDFTGVDYRTGDLAAGTLFDYAKTPLAFTATLVFLFAGIMFLVAYTQVQSLERATADLLVMPNDLQQYFGQAFKNMDKSKLSAKDKQELVYPVIEGEPAAEIRAVAKRLEDHQKKLRGDVVTDHPIPHRADVIVSDVIGALKDGQPSYDFALIKIDVNQDMASVTFFASTSETAEEISKRGGKREDLRMVDALKKLMAAKPEVYDGEPQPASGTAKGVRNGERVANEMRLNLKLQKVKEPARAAAARPAGSK